MRILARNEKHTVTVNVALITAACKNSLLNVKKYFQSMERSAKK